MRRLSVNWGAFVPPALVLTFAGGLGIGFYELFQSDIVQLDVSNAAQMEQDSVKYILTNAHTITQQDGPLSYTFNFESRHVFAAGNANGAEISGAFTFQSFDNDALIEKVRRAGCETARQTAGLLSGYDYGSLFAGEDEKVTDKAGEARRFLQNHCPQAAP